MYALASSLGCATPSPTTSTTFPPAPEPRPATASVTARSTATDGAADAAVLDVSATTPADAPSEARDAGAAANSAPEGMLLVPAGPFTMGADSGGEGDEHPAHTVTLPAFWLDTTEVPNEAYARCVGAKVCRPRALVAAASHAGPEASFARARQPVVGVSWDDAKAYCAWLGRRLPREAEFEKAVRDGDARRYPWGNDPPTPERTVFGRQMGHDATDDVGTHPSGRGPYGHDDLAGNVWEWIDDEYDPIAYQRPTAEAGVPGTCGQIMAAQTKLRAERIELGQYDWVEEPAFDSIQYRVDQPTRQVA